MKLTRALLLLSLFTAMLPWRAHPAFSQSATVTCTASVGNVSFGSLAAGAGIAGQTTATVTYSCNGGSPNTNVRGCLALGSGSGGAASGNSPRYLRRSDNAALNHNLRTSAGGPIWSTTPVVTPIPLGANGTGTASATIFADVPAGQSSVQAGSYSSVFSGATNVTFSYGPGGSCSTPGASPSFTVSANVTASCTLSVAPLDFGTIASLAGNVDASTSVTATCTSGVPYSISLGLGNGSGVSTPAARKMTDAANTLTYGIYQNAARTTAWGDQSSNDYDGTGTGTPQSIPVYGRVPPQPMPPAGTYRDTVVVTITY